MIGYTITRLDIGWELTLYSGNPEVVFKRQVKRYIEALSIVQMLGIHLNQSDLVLAA